jgi:hypothetical protein
MQTPTHLHLADYVLTKTLLKAEDFLKEISMSTDDITWHQRKCGNGSDVRMCLLAVGNSRVYKTNGEWKLNHV